MCGCFVCRPCKYACEGQKRTLDLLELELKRGVRHHGVLRLESGSFIRAPSALNSGGIYTAIPFLNF